MSETTNIEWATSTGNPWIGCTKVSPGCKNCYAAELDANRFSKTMGCGTKEQPESHWGKGMPRVRTKAFWKDAAKWNKTTVCDECGQSLPLLPPDKLDGHARPIGNCAASRCLGKTYHRPRIFPSLCDWLDEEVPIEWLADFLKLIHDTPNLDWLLLTKRPENFEERIEAAFEHSHGEGWQSLWTQGEPPENVWLGVSVEDQRRADERIPLLLQIPAKVRFLSVEPLLEPVSLEGYVSDGGIALAAHGKLLLSGPVVDWVIIGGESGPNRRDCGVSAIEGVARQCIETHTPCFVKQDSAFKPGQRGRISDEVWALKQFPTP